MSDSLRPHELQHTRLPCPSPTLRAYSNSCPLSWWSNPLSSPSPPDFSISQHQGLIHWVSSSHQLAKVLEFQLQHQSLQWIFRTDPLGWTGWISLESKGLSRVFSNTTVQKHQFFAAQLFSQTNSHIWSHHFMAHRWRNSGNSGWLYFGGLKKSLQMVIAAMKLKDAYSLEGKLWPT